MSTFPEAGRLRLRDGLITFLLAGAVYLVVPGSAGFAFGPDSLATYLAAFIAAPVLALLALAWPLAVRHVAPAELGFAPPRPGWMLRAAFTILVIVPATAALALAIEAVFDVSFEDINDSLYALSDLDTVGLIAAGVGIVVLAPVAEELLLRGVVFGALRSRFGPAPTIFISAALFAVLHIAWAVMPIIFLLGLVFGWLRHRSGSVAPSILLHALNNLWSFSIFLLVQ